MNDDTTITAVHGSLSAARDSLSGVHLGTPVDTIVRRGRNRRQRRAMGGLTAVTAVAGGIAIAAVTLSSAATPDSPVTAKLAAWTVATQTDGTVRVTIQDVRDASGLQEALRADGIPVTVSFPGGYFEGSTAGPPLPAGCQAVTMSDTQNADLQERIMPLPIPKTLNGSEAVILIKPAAIPAGVGLNIEAWAAPAGTLNGPVLSVETGLVQASPDCTGS